LKFLSITRISLCLAMGIAVLVSAAASGLAQNNKKSDAELRTIHGSVVDSSDSPVPSSVVYLMNAKTEAVRTYIADDAGNYRFSGLDPNVDYQIHAEHNEFASSTRTISNFDTRKDISLTLKLSAKKAAR
jgi:protocatechuate 3,4-dioxygenase beta subunit